MHTTYTKASTIVKFLNNTHFIFDNLYNTYIHVCIAQHSDLPYRNNSQEGRDTDILQTRFATTEINPFMGLGKITSYLSDFTKYTSRKSRTHCILLTFCRALIWLILKNGKADLLASFQAKKCAVLNDGHLASMGNHIPKLVSNYRQ